MEKILLISNLPNYFYVTIGNKLKEEYDIVEAKAETNAMSKISPSVGTWLLFLDKELLERVQVLLEEEPERTRNIVNLRLEGYSFYEIGKLQGISESSARVIYFREKEKLRQILVKEGLGRE